MRIKNKLYHEINKLLSIIIFIKFFYFKIKLIISMRKLSFKYIDWRINTAYPNGWKFIFQHPIVFIKDLNRYLNWCLEINKIIKF